MVQLKRPGLKDGVRTEFTIMADVKPGHEQVVRETIERGNVDPSRVEAAKALGISRKGLYLKRQRFGL